MSWDADLVCAECGDFPVDQNYTHNTNRMISEALLIAEGEPAPECGGPLGKAIGPAWWDRLNLMTGEQGAHYLGFILLGLRSDPDRFRAMNPDNGWGDYDSLLGVIQRMWEASCAHPLARWHTSG